MAGFDTIYYDVVGVCNAKCSYCHTGIYKTANGSIVEPERFRQTIDVIARHGLLNAGGAIGLYNWGEPFLHPRLNELVHILNDRGLGYGFSTNASRVPVIDPAFVAGLKYLVYSMPGFSQDSYDKMHGFRFADILSNIRSMTRRAREAGFEGRIAIYYHVYQFSAGETFQCEDFAHECGIEFVPMYAILNNWSQINAFVDNRLDPPLLSKIGQELFMHDVKALLAKAPADYACPQYNWLAIDENSNLLLCCQVPTGREYSTGNLLTDDVAEMLVRRQHNDTCRECVGKGLAYYLNNSLGHPEFYVEARKRIDGVHDGRAPGSRAAVTRAARSARRLAGRAWRGARALGAQAGIVRRRSDRLGTESGGETAATGGARSLLGEPGVGIRLQPVPTHVGHGDDASPSPSPARPDTPSARP